jgi:hypothetical protein
VPSHPNNPIPDPIAQGSITIELEQIATGVVSPNFLTHSGDGTDRLFVVQQPGQIGIIENGVWLPTPFLDVSDRLPALGLFGLDFDERRQLGLAFHPDFSNNGKLYTFTSESISVPADFGQPPVDAISHQSVIAEWQVNAGNANAPDPSGAAFFLIRSDAPLKWVCMPLQTR